MGFFLFGYNNDLIPTYFIQNGKLVTADIYSKWEIYIYIYIYILRFYIFYNS